MSEALTSRQTDYLFILMQFDEPVSNPTLRKQYGFDIVGDDRRAFGKLGYVSSELAGGCLYHELTDAGWRHCREILAADPDENAKPAARVAQGVRNMWDRYLDRHQLELADVVAVKPESARSLTPELLYSVYSELAAHSHEWVQLHPLRQNLSDVPRAELDEMLLRLFRERKLKLLGEANRKTLTPADRTAAIRVGNEDRHLLSIGQRL